VTLVARPRVVVVGAGVSGCECTWGLARAGVACDLITTSLDTIANLPGDGWRFEPPPGGLLAFVSEEARDAAGRWRSRALHRAVKRELERSPEVHVLQSTVTGLLIEGQGERARVRGVRTWEGVDRHGELVALTVGSFLHARLRVGVHEEPAGRLSETSYEELYQDLSARGLRFRDAELTLAGDEVTPSYTVRFRVFDPEVLAPDGAIRGCPGAYAFGQCAVAHADLSAAAESGSRGAATLVAALGG
jgi:tRNA U34 5-carboxymethylaminomethyl modifying enzyme MnmG/GidA